jgi:hypothetical protein
VSTSTPAIHIALGLLIRNSESRLDIVPLHKGTDGPLQYDYNLAKSVRLPGAHGEEIVRDLFTDTYVSNHTFSSSNLADM